PGSLSFFFSCGLLLFGCVEMSRISKLGQGFTKVFPQPEHTVVEWLKAYQSQCLKIFCSFLQGVCDHDRACGRGFSCDRHFGLCVALRGEGHYCRRDSQCVRGLSCMFGKCHRSIPNGQEVWVYQINLCKVDRDCGPSMCCARHHGEQVCKRRLMRGESCYVPDGGLAFSINQICPCDEGLLCRGNSAPHWRE
uniref:Dickkopf N-terminal cysteine-rich domain-containing protein n=1 Tax=Myripristis murdjan TaxID=586833 RepID=A0A668AS70_9TELE